MMQLMKINLFLVILFIVSSMRIWADNPLVRHIFTADPAPMVYNDTFYIFTGRDEGKNNGWIMNGWHVLSSADMVNWTDHGMVLAVKDVTWLNKSQAWAAHCIERNGKFYFYICDSGEIGVAVADNILGPYKDALGKPLISNATPGACPGDDNIDPAVFIDDDGQAYLYWGTDGVVRQAKLKSNMIELDGAITVPQGLNRFFEASWVHKRNGIYYYSYAAKNSTGASWPSNIDYAISSNPLGPWTYKGTVNDFAGTGTNHSGIIKFKDKWYFVYHTDYLSGGTPWQRSVQVDYLNYNADGTLKKVVQTTTGVESIGEPLFSKDAFYKIKARHSGKLLEVANASKENNAVVQQYSDNGEFCQHWKVVEIENGVYEIINRNSGLVLDAVRENEKVIQYSRWGGANQKWKITSVGNGAYYIVNKSSMEVLDVYYAETTDRAKIQHWPFNGETCQMWEFIKVDSVAVGTVTLQKKDFSIYTPEKYKGIVYMTTDNGQILSSSKILDLTGRMYDPSKIQKPGFRYLIQKK
ncbi:MAG: family 43 glycosylhydrolase [Fibrobacter sp.]|nr:family 43 glycosylhydrolase [Fibrobacter sp.]